MSKYPVEIRILMGLPGSGKSTFASSFDKDKYFSTVEVIDFDLIRQKADIALKGREKVNKQEYLDRYVESTILPFKSGIKTVICDGLFLTQNEIEWLLGIILNSSCFSTKYMLKKLYIDYWTPDRNACLFNDKGRRDKSSLQTIKSAKMEEPDITDIKSKFNIENIVKVVHTVQRKPAYKEWANRYGIEDSAMEGGRYLTSCSWSLGGFCRSWTGEKYPISAEEPCEFEEFDNLIGAISPNITFLQYKKLWNRCVTVEEKDDSDYYSRTRSAYYRCDLEELYEEMNEMGMTERKGFYYDSHGGDSGLNSRTGEKITIIRPLTEKEADLFEVGPMYRVRFEDGYETDVFEDEISKF